MSSRKIFLKFERMRRKGKNVQLMHNNNQSAFCFSFYIHTSSMKYGFSCGTILFASAQCAHITPNMQSVRKQLIDRKSLESSEFSVSVVSLYQFLGSENANSKLVTINTMRVQRE